MPPDSELGKRVHQYKFKVEHNKAISRFVKAFGNTTGKGVLRVVESIYGDPANNVLLVAEEDRTNTYVKVYDMQGRFKNETIGEGLFKAQVEGITLFTCGSGKGYWIITDQSITDNIFHFLTGQVLNIWALLKEA
jgi:3-phytase